MTDKWLMCSNEVVEVTGLGDSERQYLNCGCMCNRRGIQEIGEQLKCGFYDFCSDCSRKFRCATERR
jgi:hypothetical protein